MKSKKWFLKEGNAFHMKDYLDEYIVVTRLIHRPQGASIYELASALDKTTRAIYTILNQLETMKFPIWTDSDPNNLRIVRYHADSTFMQSLPTLEFTDADKAVFNYLIDCSRNSPAMEIQARQLFYKLKIMASERGSIIENKQKKPLAIISSSTVVKKIDNKKTSKIIPGIVSAIEKNQWITFDYYNIYKKQSYGFTVYPIVIFVDKGDYYLYAFNKYEELRMLAIERINNIISVDNANIPSKKIDVKKLLEDPFGTIYDSEPFKVKFLIDDEATLFVLQKKWPDSVKITEQEDGSIIFEAETHSIYDCKAWIMQRAANVTVLEPEWLIDDIKYSLQVGLALYQ